MFQNFEKLEKSLDFIESLESKELAANERFKLLQKIDDMQNHIEFLEDKLNTYEKATRDKNLRNVNNTGTNSSGAVTGDLKFHRKLKSQGVRSVGSINEQPSSFNYYENAVENNLSHTREFHKATGLFNIEEYGYHKNKNRNGEENDSNSDPEDTNRRED